MAEIKFKRVEDQVLRYLQGHEYIVNCDCGNKELPMAIKVIDKNNPNTYKFICKDCKILHEVTEKITKNQLEIKLNGEIVYFEILEK